MDSVNNRVGIGTTTPSSPLHIEGTSSGPVPLTLIKDADRFPLDIVSTEAGAYPHYIRFYRNSASPAANYDIGTLAFEGNDSTSARRGYGYVGGRIIDTTSTSIDSVIFFKTTSNNSEVEPMTISGTNVGVGTTTPNTQLHVNGSLTSIGSSLFRISDSTAPGGYLEIHEGTGVANQFIPRLVGRALGTGYAGRAGLQIIGEPGEDGSDDEAVVIVGRTSAGGNLSNANILEVWNGAGTEQLVVGPSGNVGIGTTTPSTALHVVGTVTATAGDIVVIGGSFIDDGTTLNVPDYVFDADYHLKPLTQVKEYMEKHKHLDGLPDMNDKKGWASLSMQDRDMKLLEKIEELTLYLIQSECRKRYIKCGK